MQSQENTILYFITKSTEFLTKKSIPNPRRDAELILSDLLSLPKIILYSKFDMPLSESQITEYRAKIKERGNGKPVAYITGKKGFHDFEFHVSPSVLIPRPETEELVEIAIESWRKSENKGNILDLCTGSGCIAITLFHKLKQTFPELKLLGTDISPDAILVAEINKKSLLKDFQGIDFIESNLFEKIDPSDKFSLIVSNPPYVLPEERSSLMNDVILFEPELALIPDNFDNLHENIMTESMAHLYPGGALLMETNPKKMEFLNELGNKLNYVEIENLNDLSGKKRFWKGRRPLN